MNTKSGDSSTRDSREIIFLGRDEELYGAVDAYARSMEWTTTRAADVGSAVAICKQREGAVCLIEGALDDFDTIAALVSLLALKKRPRLVAYIDDCDASTMNLAKRSFGLDEVFLKPCDLTTLVTCLIDESPDRSVSRPAAEVEAPAVVTQAVGGGA